MSGKIKVLVVEPMKLCEVREIDGSLETMQAIVGGHIQAVYPFPFDEIALICNEQAKLMGLPYNRPLTNDRGIPYDIICGTFFLAGQGGEDFVSLTDEPDPTVQGTLRQYDGFDSGKSAAQAKNLRKEEGQVP